MSHPVRTMLMKVAAVALTVGGCGSSDGIPREPISGTVTTLASSVTVGDLKLRALIVEAGENRMGDRMGTDVDAIPPEVGKHCRR